MDSLKSTTTISCHFIQPQHQSITCFVPRYTYDNSNEHLSSVEVEGTLLRYQYTPDSALESIRDHIGIRQEFTYNDDGIYSGSTTYDQFGGLENRVSFIHDNSGRVVSFEEPKNDTTVYIYDEIANLGYVKTLGTLSYRFERNYATGSKTVYIGDQVRIKTCPCVTLRYLTNVQWHSVHCVH